MKLTLDGLHVANYPGRGRHSILFDFGVQGPPGGGEQQVYHYNARFEADDGETVPVRNFPISYDVVPGDAGITFGFQTINVASSFDRGLSHFLGGDVFKTGLAF